MEYSKYEYICEGCDRVSEEYTCLAYAHVPTYYIRQGCCYFNRPTPEKKVDVRGRVGQKKGYSQRIGG